MTGESLFRNPFSSMPAYASIPSPLHLALKSSIPTYAPQPPLCPSNPNRPCKTRQLSKITGSPGLNCTVTRNSLLSRILAHSRAAPYHALRAVWFGNDGCTGLTRSRLFHLIWTRFAGEGVVMLGD